MCVASLFQHLMCHVLMIEASAHTCDTIACAIPSAIAVLPTPASQAGGGHLGEAGVQCVGTRPRLHWQRVLVNNGVSCHRNRTRITQEKDVIFSTA